MEQSCFKSINPVEIREVIKKIPIPRTNVDDKLWWHGIELEKLFVRHVYICLIDLSPVGTIAQWRWIWKVQVSVKVKAWV